MGNFDSSGEPEPNEAGKQAKNKQKQFLVGVETKPFWLLTSQQSCFDCFEREPPARQSEQKPYRSFCRIRLEFGCLFFRAYVKIDFRLQCLDELFYYLPVLIKAPSASSDLSAACKVRATSTP